MSKGVAIPMDVYNKDGDLTNIDFTDRSGEFIIKADWDPREEQTSENRVKFRKWAYRIIEQMDYEILK